MDYSAYVKESKKLQGGGYNKNKFRLGKYRVRITRLVSRRTRTEKDQTVFEGEVIEVLNDVPGTSCKVGESCSISDIMHGERAYFAQHMLTIAAAVTGETQEDLKGPDPEEDIEGAKAATANLLELYTSLFPSDLEEGESVAVGETVLINVVPKKDKPDWPAIYIDYDNTEDDAEAAA